MSELDSLERCAAYAASRGALAAIHRASIGWPAELAEQARAAAIQIVTMTAEAWGHVHASPARRRCVRDALATALELAAMCDVARALGLAGGALEEAQRHTGRTLALLGMLFHANAHRVGD